VRPATEDQVRDLTAALMLLTDKVDTAVALMLDQHDAAARDEHFSLDFGEVEWHGRRFTFNRNQAAAVSLLWGQRTRGAFAVDERKIGGLIGSANRDFKMRHLFRAHPALGTLIVPGERPRTWRLAGPAAPNP
jgi:hypothetical protein